MIYTCAIIQSYTSCLHFACSLRSARSGAPRVRKYGNYASKKFWFWENRPCGVRQYVRPPLHVSGYEMAHFNTICVKLGIGHPCCDQLTAVKKGYPLTSVTWLHRGLRYTTHGSDVIFWSYPLTSCLFLIDHGHRSIFLMVEFSLLSAYGQSIINWGRHFLKHISIVSLLALAKSLY